MGYRLAQKTNVKGRVGQPQTLIVQTRYNKFICYKSSTTNCLRYVAFSCYTYTIDGQVRSRQESMDLHIPHPIHVQCNDVMFTTIYVMRMRTQLILTLMYHCYIIFLETDFVMPNMSGRRVHRNKNKMIMMNQWHLAMVAICCVMVVTLVLVFPAYLS